MGAPNWARKRDSSAGERWIAGNCGVRGRNSLLKHHSCPCGPRAPGQVNVKLRSMLSRTDDMCSMYLGKPPL